MPGDRPDRTGQGDPQVYIDLRISGGSPETVAWAGYMSYVGSVDVTALADGGWVTSWQNGSAGSYTTQSLTHAVYGPSGGTPTQISAGTVSSFEVTALASGGWAATIQFNGGYWTGASFVRTRGHAEDGSTLSDARADVSPSTTATAALADGGWVVLRSQTGYTIYTPEDTGVFLDHYSADGQVIGDARRVSTTRVQNDVAGLAGGGWVVALDDDFRLYDAAGKAGAAGSLLKAGERLHDDLQLTALASGSWLATWTTYSANENDLDLRQRLFTGSKAVSTTVTAVNSTVRGAQHELTTTALEDGGWVSVWVSDGQDGDGTGIYARIFNANGTARTAEFRVNDVTAGNQTDADVAMLEDGRFVITWTTPVTSSSTGTTRSHVSQAVYEADGTFLARGQVSSTGSSGESDASVAALADGGWVIAWQALGITPYGYNESQIRQQSFHLSDFRPGIDGTGGNDRLTGTAIGEEINGFPGNDTLDGRGGADTMTGGAGDDLYIVDSIRDRVVEAGLEGSDTVRASVSYGLPINVEHLVLTGAGDADGTGNGLANRITGTAGDNLLSGLAGNDTLEGKGGVDILIGGAGNDTYVLDAGAAAIRDTAGLDTVTTTLTRSLAEFRTVEALTLLGSRAIDGTGNTLANLLTGNAAANRLDGGAGNDSLSGAAGRDSLTGGTGNDTLDGGAGIDRLTGGTGADRFLFDVAPGGSNGADILVDFDPRDDVIALENAVFTRLTSTGTLSATRFKDLSLGRADSSDLILYDRADGEIFYDANGAAGGGLVAFASVRAGTVLTAADFLVV